MIWTVFFCCLVGTVTLEYLDEDCLLSNGQLGKCKLFYTCPYAANLLRNREEPVICEFKGLEAVVCCAMDQETTVNTVPILVGNVLDSTAAGTTVATITTSLSERKCEEFHPKPDFWIQVVGGEGSLAKEFPHMAIIGYGDKNDTSWSCGGSLVSEKFVLTAAHCLNSNRNPPRWVRLGDLDLSVETDDAEPQDFSIVRRISHPNYRYPVRYNDIALLELDRQANFTDYVSPACLHTNRNFNGTRMTATGWGKTDFNGVESNFLMKVDLDYVDNDRCSPSFVNVTNVNLPNGIIDGQICAGGVVGQDTCQGDSGGPLQIKNHERTFKTKVHTLIGITSFGKPCGLTTSPGVYTRVSEYVPWIESIIWPNEK